MVLSLQVMASESDVSTSAVFSSLIDWLCTMHVTPGQGTSARTLRSISSAFIVAVSTTPSSRVSLWHSVTNNTSCFLGVSGCLRVSLRRVAPMSASLSWSETAVSRGSMGMDF